MHPLFLATTDFLKKTCYSWKHKIFLALIFFLFFKMCFASENIVYTLRKQTPDRMAPFTSTLNSLKRNYRKIDILIPQAYVINELGQVNKNIEPEILDFAKQHHIKIMPLVTNSSFDKEKAHQFLFDVQAQKKAIETLIQLCKINHFYGAQFDFEMINIADRDALTHFYTFAANEFHQNHLFISFAIAPVVTEQPDSLFLKKIYDNWEGAYNLKAIGQFADFVSIMAYNQHGSGTTPGPTASNAWVKQAILYTLQFIPASKISLGLADYSTHWFTGSTQTRHQEKIIIQTEAISYEHAMLLISQNKIPLIWDRTASSFYGIFSRHWLYEYVFLENAQSFFQKYKRIDQYHLRGVSLFDLGTEDPRIWKYLKNKKTG